MRERDLVIVGGGPAGMAAAISASQAGVKDILLLERDQSLGGILNQCLHTGFGLHHFKEELTGPEYADRFIKQIETLPVEINLRSFVVSLTKGKVLTYIKPGSLVEIRAKALIMATGCRERTREMIQVPGTRPAGIFPAGLAQKLINIEGLLPGKEVVIIGSGDIGLIMARRFTLEGAKVKAVIEVEKESRGLIRNVVQCLEDFNIPLYLRHRVTNIFGKDRVEKVEVTNLETNQTFGINCDTVLISVGLVPETELIEMAGPNVPGLFNCGNSLKVYDLVDWATRDSIKTGAQAAAYLTTLS